MIKPGEAGFSDLAFDRLMFVVVVCFACGMLAMRVALTPSYATIEHRGETCIMVNLKDATGSHIYCPLDLGE